MIVRGLDLIFAGLLLWAAAMNLNDPDPRLWVAYYGATGLLALSSAAGRAPVWTAATLSMAGALWAASLLPQLAGWTPADLGATMTPERPQVEVGRETIGLLIAASWSGLIWGRVMRARRSSGDDRPANRPPIEQTLHKDET